MHDFKHLTNIFFFIFFLFKYIFFFEKFLRFLLIFNFFPLHLFSFSSADRIFLSNTLLLFSLLFSIFFVFFFFLNLFNIHFSSAFAIRQYVLLPIDGCCTLYELHTLKLPHTIQIFTVCMNNTQP